MPFIPFRPKAAPFYPGTGTLPSPPSSAPSPIKDTWATFTLSLRTRDGDEGVELTYSTTSPMEIEGTENMRKLAFERGMQGVAELGQTGRKKVEISSPRT